LPGAMLPLMVLQLVEDVAVERPDAKMVPRLAVAFIVERSRKVARGMVLEGKEDLKWSCFLGQ
jgi:hypothetical protein